MDANLQSKKRKDTYGPLVLPVPQHDARPPDRACLAVRIGDGALRAASVRTMRWCGCHALVRVACSRRLYPSVNNKNHPWRFPCDDCKVGVGAVGALCLCKGERSLWRLSPMAA